MEGRKITIDSKFNSYSKVFTFFLDYFQHIIDKSDNTKYNYKD